MNISGEQMNISVLLPTRGRYAGMCAAVETLFQLAAAPTKIEFLIRADFDDSAYYNLVIPSAWNFYLASGPRLGYANMHGYYNELAEMARGKLLFVWNDDTEMLTQGWDEMLLKFAHTPVVQFVRVENKGQADTTFPVIDRRIFETVGRLSAHCYVDTWLDKVSAMAGVQVLRNDIVIRHHRLNDQTASDNRAAINNEHARWFGMDAERARDAEKVKELLAQLAKETK